jgi:hypothetical protein
MERKRKIVKYGGSYLIKLLSADLLDFNLKVGDEVNISEINKENKVFHKLN